MSKNENIKEKRTTRKQRTRRRKIKSIILTILEIIFIGLIIYSSINIYKWWKDNRNNKKLIEKAANAVTVVNNNDENEKQKYKVDFNQLKNTNEDVVGWLKVNGTDVEFPVVQTSDNEYYLNHSLDKSVNGAGWIFVDYRNELDGSDKNIVIYGHNRRDNSMFGTLKNILEEDWYDNDDNKIVYFITEDNYTEYEVFSVYQTESEDYYITTDFNSDEFGEFIQNIKSRSENNFEVDVDASDEVLTLSTCANNNKYRVVLHAKKVKSEKISE